MRIFTGLFSENAKNIKRSFLQVLIFMHNGII